MTLRLLSQWLAWLLVLAIAVFTLSPIELRPVTAAPANWERFTTFMAIGGAPLPGLSPAPVAHGWAGDRSGWAARGAPAHHVDRAPWRGVRAPVLG
jgi:hypothetical protein